MAEKKLVLDSVPLDAGLASARKPLDALWTSFAGMTGRREGEVTIAFVSPHHGAGTTTVAGCTALGLARNLPGGVCLIEANCFTPGLAAYLDVEPAPGITDVLDGAFDIHQAVRPTRVRGLDVLTAGTPRAVGPGELTTKEATELFLEAGQGHRYVLIDAPPLLSHTPSRVLLELADCVVLVVQAHATKKTAGKEAMALLDDLRVDVLGTVVNRFETDMPFGIGRGRW